MVVMVREVLGQLEAGELVGPGHRCTAPLSSSTVRFR